MFPIVRREMYGVILDKRFPDEFKKYVAEQKYVTNSLSSASRWVYEFDHIDNSLSSAEYRRAVDELIRPLLESHFAVDELVQFWRAEEITEVNNNSVGERRFLLTIRNQPFLLQDFRYYDGTISDRLCGYRTKMHDVIFNGDGTGGPIGRVFLNNRLEYTPNVSYYTDKEEYPQRDLALSCGINSSLVLPWRDYYGSVVGSIEFVSPLGLPLLDRLSSKMLRSIPLYSDYCKRLCGQYDLVKGSLISAVTEIDKVIGQVCERRDVVRCAQTWMLCKHCNSLSTVKRCALELKASSQHFIIDLAGSFFLEYQDYYYLKKGEGVVGNAAESSHDLVYCEDVSELSITEYPLAHLARYYQLSASFAIRLKSNQTGDQVYALEFFLHPEYIKGKNLIATLVPILETMTQHFKTFKFASGGEIGGSLHVQIIDARFFKKNENFKIGGLDLMDNHLAFIDSINNGGNMASNVLNEIESAITGSTEKLHNAQKLGDRGSEFTTGVTDVDVSEQPLLVANFLSHSRECAVMQQKLVSHSPDKVETLRNEKLDLTLTVGSYHYKASDFRHNMERFGRQGESSRPAFLQKSVSESTKEETDDLMIGVETSLQDISMEDAPVASASTVQSEIRVTIEASDGVDSTRFPLSASSGIRELYHQVSQRLQRADTTFDLKYRDDDNDLIELKCDDDLQLYISSSREQEIYTLLVFVVPR